MNYQPQLIQNVNCILVQIFAMYKDQDVRNMNKISQVVYRYPFIRDSGIGGKL